MRSVFILLIPILLALPTMAQTDSVYAYYNQNWDRLPDSTNAAFFRVVKDAPYGRFLVRDYYIAGVLQFSAFCAKVEPTIRPACEICAKVKSFWTSRACWVETFVPLHSNERAKASVDPEVSGKLPIPRAGIYCVHNVYL